MLPGRFKDSKRKTDFAKVDGSLNFNKKFEFVMSQIEMSKQRLEVSLKAKKNWYGTKYFGMAVIKLSTLKMNESLTEWYDLSLDSKNDTKKTL